MTTEAEENLISAVLSYGIMYRHEDVEVVVPLRLIDAVVAERVKPEVIEAVERWQRERRELGDRFNAEWKALVKRHGDQVTLAERVLKSKEKK